MALLDMQGMVSTRGNGNGDGHGGGGSSLSQPLCDSFASIQLCL